MFGFGFSKKHVVQDLYVLDVFFFCRQKITQAERWCRYTESPLKGFSVARVGRSQQLNDCVHNTKEIKRSVFSLLKSYQTQFWDITCFEGEPFDGTYMPDQWYVMFVGCLVLLLLLSSPDLVVQNCRAFFCFKVFQLNQKTLKSSHPQNFRPLKNSPPCIIQVHLPFHWRVQWSLQTFSLQQNDEVSKPSKHTVPLSRSPKGSPSFGTTSAGGVASPDRSLSVEPAYHSA